MWSESPVGEDALVRIGLEPGLAGALLHTRSVVHAELGADLERGDTAPWILTEGGTFAVSAPLSGMLHQPNGLLHHQPQRLCARPLDDGWLYTLRVSPNSAEFGTLLSAGAAARLYDADSARFLDALQQALADVGSGSSASSPATLPEVADTLGPVRYFSLLRGTYG